MMEKYVPITLANLPPCSELESPAAFKQWLTGQPADAVVGCRGISGQCPLASFFKAHTGKEARVGALAILILDSNTYWSLPKWAETFVKWVDMTDYPGTWVTANLALQLLDDIVLLR